MRYEDVMDDGGISGRERETILLNRCISLLEKAEASGPASDEAHEAAEFIEKFWSILIDDLSHSGNILPVELKASLISIGCFIIKEVRRFRAGEAIDSGALKDLLGTIRDGLV